MNCITIICDKHVIYNVFNTYIYITHLHDHLKTPRIPTHTHGNTNIWLH